MKYKRIKKVSAPQKNERAQQIEEHDLGTRQAWVQAWLLTVQPQANYLISLSLNFFICK
jgi:hypothetical protein